MWAISNVEMLLNQVEKTEDKSELVECANKLLNPCFPIEIISESKLWLTCEFDFVIMQRNLINIIKKCLTIMSMRQDQLLSTIDRVAFEKDPVAISKFKELIELLFSQQSMENISLENLDEKIISLWQYYAHYKYVTIID